MIARLVMLWAMTTPALAEARHRCPEVSMIAGADLLDYTSMSAGLVLGMHVTPYDIARAL
jgi:hypothetical protein